MERKGTCRYSTSVTEGEDSAQVEIKDVHGP